MKTEKILKLSIYFLKFLMSIISLIAVGLIFIYIHSLFSPETYSKVIVTNTRSLEFRFDIEKIPSTVKEWKSSGKLIYYTKLDGFSKFRVIWSQIFSFTMFLFLLISLEKLIKNSRNYEYFFQKNIKIINQILKLLLLLFLFNIILIIFGEPITMVFENKGELPSFYSFGRVNFGFLFFYPLVYIFFFILKTVFKRGEELKQENDLTI